MFRKSLALVPVIAVLLFGFALRTNAQVYHAVNQVGSVNGSLAVSVIGSSWDTGIEGQPVQITGAVNISGYSGALGMNVSAAVQSLTIGSTKINGRTFKSAYIVTKVFPYIDLVTKIRTSAVMQITVVAYGRGTIAYQVIDSATGVTLASTGSPDGQMAPLAQTTGSTTVN